MKNTLYNKVKNAITSVVPFSPDDEDLECMAQGVICDGGTTAGEVGESLRHYNDLFTADEFEEVCYKIAEVL